jgi:hypothetical protein
MTKISRPNISIDPDSPPHPTSQTSVHLGRENQAFERVINNGHIVPIRKRAGQRSLLGVVAKGRVTDWGYAVRASPLLLEPQLNTNVTMTVTTAVARYTTSVLMSVAKAMDSRNRMRFCKMADSTFLVSQCRLLVLWVQAALPEVCVEGASRCWHRAEHRGRSGCHHRRVHRHCRRPPHWQGGSAPVTQAEPYGLPGGHDQPFGFL